MKYVHVYAFLLMSFFTSPVDKTKQTYLKIISPAQEGSKVILLNQF
jgi:hypothetical protein